MDEKIPTASKLKKLYNQALKFKEIRCWEYMEDTDMFGVMRPGSGLIGYVCILGNAGEVFGINAYLGPRGLYGYLKVLSGEIYKESLEMMSSQYCISLTFEEDESYLDGRDKSVLKELCMESQNKNALPFFRTYIPGYYPWYLTEDEVGFFEIVLEQSINVCKRFKHKRNLFETDKNNYYFVREPFKSNDNTLWKDRFIEAEPYREKWENAQINEVKLKKILKKFPQRKGSWEIGCDFFPLRIKDGKARPYMPLVFLGIDATTGEILGHSVSSLRKQNLLVAEEILNLAGKLNTIPETLIVSNRNLKKILTPLSEKLNLSIRFKKNPIYYEEAANSMIDFLNSGPRSD